MRLTRMRAGLVVLAIAGTLALVGCAAPGVGDASSTEELSALAPEGQALQAIGFTEADMQLAGAVLGASPSADPSAKPDRRGAHRWKRLRFGFGRNTLHGEAVVKTEDGTRTVVVQRGEITAISATSVTVKSTDGFSLTWTIGNPIHVVEHRKAIQPSALDAGDTVGVAGIKENNTAIARLIVIPR